jgi:anthranilate phosphoribosyltransferase
MFRVKHQQHVIHPIRLECALTTQRLEPAIKFMLDSQSSSAEHGQFIMALHRKDETNRQVARVTKHEMRYVTTRVGDLEVTIRCAPTVLH